MHIVKQTDDETEEDFLQRVFSLASDGYSEVGNDTIQQLATEAYLRALRQKDAAAIQVLNKNQKTVQEACIMVKGTIANSKAIFGSKVTFKEMLFTYKEFRLSTTR